MCEVFGRTVQCGKLGCWLNQVSWSTLDSAPRGLTVFERLILVQDVHSIYDICVIKPIKANQWHLSCLFNSFLVASQEEQSTWMRQDYFTPLERAAQKHQGLEFPGAVLVCSGVSRHSKTIWVWNVSSLLRITTSWALHSFSASI